MLRVFWLVSGLWLVPLALLVFKSRFLPRQLAEFGSSRELRSDLPWQMCNSTALQQLLHSSVFPEKIGASLAHFLSPVSQFEITTICV